MTVVNSSTNVVRFAVLIFSVSEDCIVSKLMHYYNYYYYFSCCLYVGYL